MNHRLLLAGGALLLLAAGGGAQPGRDGPRRTGWRTLDRPAGLEWRPVDESTSRPEREIVPLPVYIPDGNDDLINARCWPA